MSRRTDQAAKAYQKSHQIALYIRVSTQEQAENPEGSIKNQEERLRAVVKLKNMEGHFGEIKEVFIDRAKSGKDTNRPELQRLLTSIRKRDIDLVMVTELSRISRSIKDFSDIWDLMKANHCGFYSNRENFDTTTAAGEMVLFTVANIAQFERRQISERVTANFNARAQRGLFNGGSIPFGYRRIQDKPGFLEVDEDAAAIVKTAFKVFSQQGTLSKAAKWLNEQGYCIKKEREGGGLRSRLGFFTVENLKLILKNPFYVGIKRFSHKGEIKETQAVWPAIVDRSLFEKVNELLAINHRRNKDQMIDRFPFQLVGLVRCKTCGDRLVGKSAHGNAGKVAYYEHAWSTIKGTYVPGLKRQCEPYRVLAKQIEPVVWREVSNLIENPKFAEEILKEAKKFHLLNPGSKEIEKSNQEIFSVDRQLELLAERLASLPHTISPAPIYKQMEKLEERKFKAQDRIAALRESGVMRDEPAEMRDFEKFTQSLKAILESEDSLKVKAKVIQALVSKIVVMREGLEIFFKVGESYVKLFTKPETEKKPWLGNEFHAEQGEAEFRQKNRADLSVISPNAIQNFQKKLGVGGSNTCEIGRSDTPTVNSNS